MFEGVGVMVGVAVAVAVGVMVGVRLGVAVRVLVGAGVTVGSGLRPLQTTVKGRTKSRNNSLRRLMTRSPLVRGLKGFQGHEIIRSYLIPFAPK